MDSTAQTKLVSSIPQELRDLPQWVVWRFTPDRKTGKPRKTPFNARTGYAASSTNPDTWSTFAEALEALPGNEGVGFVFTDADDFFGVDLDACRNPETGELTAWAHEVVASVDSYCEVSPSGYGVKLVARGKLPEGSKHVFKPRDVPTFGDKTPEIAIYDRGRYWCLTGEHLEGTPTGGEQRQEALEGLLTKLFAKPAKTKKPRSTGSTSGTGKIGGTRFEALLARCAAAADGERSERDFALLAHATERNMPAEEVWEAVRNVGKFAECGRDYFDRTFRAAATAVLESPGLMAADGTKIDTWQSEHRTEVANGKRLVALNGGNMRYVSTWQKWLAWDGTRWAFDESGTIDAAAKEVAFQLWREVERAEEAAESEDEKKIVDSMRGFARTSSTKNGVTNMIALARSESGITITHDRLDRDPWALNVVNGTLNLRTGTLRLHDRQDLFTKIAPVVYDPQADCPIWCRFVDEITRGDKDLAGYLRRFIGYSLTGVVREHVLPFFWGCGANGKSTFIGVLLALLGEDYSMKAAPDLLMTKANDSHPTERADLFGKRFVACNEIEQGRRLNEALVKDLTGGDLIRARRMREDFWQFAPTHRIVLAGNHKPRVTGTDNGIWRRLHLVPFTAVFDKEQQDTELPDKLKAELSGILNWALLGCAQWQAEGLAEPDVVQEATSGYRRDQDVVGMFLDEVCLVGHDFRAKASQLYGAFEGWCRQNGEHVLSNRRFGESLTERGFERFRSGGICYQGVGLAADWSA